MTYAIDFETFYDSKQNYGIQQMGVWAYLHDERFDPYMVTICNGAQTWEGNPDEIAWKEVLPNPEWVRLANGQIIASPHFVAHNALFDRQVFERCQELGFIPKNIHPLWDCTANLSVYLGAGRSLAEASKNLLNTVVDKTMRSFMDGKQWADVADTEAGPKLREYARKDAELCWRLWNEWSDKWPEIERQASEITMQQCMRGIAVNRELLETGMEQVKDANINAMSEIPWTSILDEDGKEIPPTSPKAFKALCKECGVPAPKSLADGDESLAKWLSEQPADSGPAKVVKAMQTVRSTNMLYTKANTLLTRIRPDGTFPFELKYFGGHTGRWSGGYEDDASRTTGTGFNIQNLSRKAMFGLDLRHCLIPRAGNKFVIADYSQIEPRCLAWFCKDSVALDLMKQGMSPYEAHARVSMGWTGGKLSDENPFMYSLAKARILALGYGSGHKKLITMARLYISEADFRSIFIDVVPTQEQVERYEEYLGFVKEKKPDWQKDYDNGTEEERRMLVNSWVIVVDYRAANPKVKEMWDILTSHAEHAVGKDFRIQLPSGRSLLYTDVRTHGGLTVQIGRSGLRKHVWGGFFTENLCQATARDIMRDALVRLEEAGIQTIFTSHDEIIAEVPISFETSKMKNIMTQPISWMPGIPLAVKCEDAYMYQK